ncbi:unnamed protein product [Prorocentrum cordatum]|uniref:Uncharacterized protein n=1 Tax=Prorocentrum cordatum TaxID=2364126 RepID=A0ABN9RB40_9DINO|nr:unnamed protein product [Polarella glacialis]
MTCWAASTAAWRILFMSSSFSVLSVLISVCSVVTAAWKFLMWCYLLMRLRSGPRRGGCYICLCAREWSLQLRPLMPFLATEVSELYVLVESVMRDHLPRTHQGADSSLIVVLCAAAVVVMLAYPAWLSWRRRNDVGREPSWSIFLLCCCIIAWVLAAVLGSINYGLSAELREYEKLDYYVDVDASKSIGQGVQDAGRVFFLPGAHLDLNKSMSFMSSTNYCVAPVVSGDALGAGYDFWAVGTECCGTQEGINYTCGDYNSPNAAAGLRDLDESAKVYYRLAVEAAEAAYGISVAHPVFLIWTCRVRIDEAVEICRDCRQSFQSAMWEKLGEEQSALGDPCRTVGWR